MDVGIFQFDFTDFFAFFDLSPAVIVWRALIIGGWVMLSYLLLYIVREFYVGMRQDRVNKNWKWVLLAIDIPALNVQTPLAVEQMFSHLAGALGKPSLAEKMYGGYKQRFFSLEIISIEGYIQFLIRTESLFQDLVETAIYAQYPEAEIIEVEDYVTAIPNTFPNPTHDIWAADFGLAEHDVYPIRTYREFEHNISKDTVLKDPMGTFLESFSRIGPGEQMWFQIIVEPASSSWKEEGIKKIKQVIGDSSLSVVKEHAIDKAAAHSLKFLETLGDQVFARPAADAKKEVKKEGPANKLSTFTPGQMKIVEEMEKKITKLGFKTKMRGMYLARKQVFRPERGIHAMIGAINQFNIPSQNSFVIKSGTDNDLKKTLLMEAFKKRKMKMGGNPFVLNIEELATVWHFPMSHVKTPLLQKATGKRAEPPASLPVGELPETSFEEPLEGESQPLVVLKRPTLTDAGDVHPGHDDELPLG